MVRTLYASTLEFDDSQAAVEDILGQLDLKGLDANSVGIMTCPAESLKDEAIKALADALPFDLIGCTTLMSDLCGEWGEDQISLMVLTGDDIEFSCALSDQFDDNCEATIADLYESALSGLSTSPVMGLTFAPFMYLIGADRQVRALDKASGGLPIFGTVALNYSDKVEIAYTFVGGDYHEDRMALLLIGGSFDPKFFFASIPETRFLKQKAIITASDGNVLKEVNGINAMAHLETLGIADGNKIESIPLVPLSIDIGDGATPVARAILASTDEGHIICGGDMPIDAALGVGFIDRSDVQETAQQVAQEALDSGANNGVIIISCFSRLGALGLDTSLEFERVQSVLKGKVPYLMLYSAGELYPEIIDGKTYNKAHNDTMLACAF